MPFTPVDASKAAATPNATPASTDVAAPPSPRPGTKPGTDADKASQPLPLCVVSGTEPVALFKFPSVQSEHGMCAYTPPCTIAYQYDEAAPGISVNQQVRSRISESCGH